MNKKILFLILIAITAGITSCNAADSTEPLSESSVEISSKSSSDDYGYFIRGKDGAAGIFSYEGFLRYIEKWPPMLGDPNTFKNTTEVEIKTKEEAIERAKNELLDTFTFNGCTYKYSTDYAYVDVYYDESSSMWAVIFHNNAAGGDQDIFMDSKGITKLIQYGE